MGEYTLMNFGQTNTSRQSYMFYYLNMKGI